MLLGGCRVLRKGIWNVSITNQLLSVKFFNLNSRLWIFLFPRCLFATRSDENLDLPCTHPGLSKQHHKTQPGLCPSQANQPVWPSFIQSVFYNLGSQNRNKKSFVKACSSYNLHSFWGLIVLLNGHRHILPGGQELVFCSHKDHGPGSRSWAPPGMDHVSLLTRQNNAPCLSF